MPLIYATLWLRAYAARALNQARLTWHTATWFEALTVIAFSVAFLATVPLAIRDRYDWWRLSGDLAVLIVLTVIVYEHARERRVWHALGLEHLRKPTGAPRVAEITCSAGRTHRFMYTDQGWVEAGPPERSSL